MVVVGSGGDSGDVGSGGGGGGARCRSVEGDGWAFLPHPYLSHRTQAVSQGRGGVFLADTNATHDFRLLHVVILRKT